MNNEQIKSTLASIFASGVRAVVWNDPEGDFAEELESVLPDGVALIDVGTDGTLAAKIKIERELGNSPVLLYSATPVPPPTDDWLLDIRLYGKEFSADPMTLILDDLGLQTHTLLPFVTKHKPFFANKGRLEKLKKWVVPDDRERELEKKMIAVVVRADQPELFQILLRLFSELSDLADESEVAFFQTDTSIKSLGWKDVEKFDLADSFWDQVSEAFGYKSTSPTLPDLLTRLLISDLAVSSGGPIPSELGSFVIADRSGRINASVFLSQWRTNITFLNSYKRLSALLASEIGVRDLLKSAKTTFDVGDSDTFEELERYHVRTIVDSIADGTIPNDTTSLEGRIRARRDRFWARNEPKYSLAYSALLAAIGLQNQRRRYEGGFGFSDAESAFTRYTADLFLIDQYYRLFNDAALQLRALGFDLLKVVEETVERIYGNWYLTELADAWEACLANENLMKSWKIGGITNQYSFFKEYVVPTLEASPDRKAFVVISDGFRFEAAEEYARGLNTESDKGGKGLMQASIEAMLGVVPSYTALGMASLLPHSALSYKGTDVLADGQSTAGLGGRNAVLKKFGGIALQHKDLIEMSREDARELVRPHRVIYIYHNEIDAIGDSLQSERNTFVAVRSTINSLASLVSLIVNTLNGSQIFVTADHGFLFQADAPDQLDKSTLEVKSGSVLKRKKRYVVNPEIEPQANAWHGKIADTSNLEGEMEFLIPKGTNRFHLAGGARYFHGGAMLQEIAVPVVSIKRLRGNQAKRSSVRKADVTLLGTTSKVVNNVQRFEFVQTEKVSDRVLPRTLRILLIDESGSAISNEEVVTFGSESDSLDDRRASVQLILKSATYDRNKPYYLVLFDDQNLIKEYFRKQFTIDISFSSDF